MVVRAFPYVILVARTDERAVLACRRQPTVGDLETSSIGKYAKNFGVGQFLVKAQYNVCERLLES
jgi:hypothetical protein